MGLPTLSSEDASMWFHGTCPTLGPASLEPNTEPDAVDTRVSLIHA